MFDFLKSNKKQNTMPEKNKLSKAKPTDFRVLHKGTHNAQIKDKDPKMFSWIYELQRNRKLSKLTIQQFEIEKGERKEIGDPIKIEGIRCVLQRSQARDFVRNTINK